MQNLRQHLAQAVWLPSHQTYINTRCKTKQNTRTHARIKTIKARITRGRTFNLFFKTMRDRDVFMLSGSKFQAEGPPMKKKRSPNFDLDLGTGRCVSPSEAMRASGYQ